jgi:hypothetical protein
MEFKYVLEKFHGYKTLSWGHKDVTVNEETK